MAALDFPASPSTGQTYAGPGGAVWSWDGAKWVNGASAAAVVSSFNTRTGAVTLSSGDVTTALTFTPYNATNPSGYQTAANVTTALAAGQPGAFTTLSASGAVSGSGFTTLLTPYAPLASPPLTGTPTAPTVAATAAAGTTQLATTAFVRTGTTTNDNAVAGQVGEYLSTVVASPGPSLTTGALANVATLSLTAGDWDVCGNVAFNLATSGTTITGLISTVSAGNTPVTPAGVAGINSTGLSGNSNVSTGTVRISLASTANVYLVAYANFTGAANAWGTIMARRVR